MGCQNPNYRLEWIENRDEEWKFRAIVEWKVCKNGLSGSVLLKLNIFRVYI